MVNLGDMIWIETRKAIRSKMPLATTLGSIFISLAIAFIIFVSKNPALSQKLGLISAKANLLAYAGINWAGYLSLLTEVVAAGGFILFCLITSWVFGREFADGTLKDMLAVPVERASILLAKFIVVAVWSLILIVIILITGLAMGAVIHLPQGSLAVILQGSAIGFITAVMTIAVVTPFAFFASIGRGYLLPMGMAMLALVMANLAGVIGWGEYFPWSVPGFFSQGKSPLPPASFWIVFLTGVIGMLITYLWWMAADQNR